MQRRRFLQLAGTLVAATIVPFKALAAFVRPESALKATSLDAAFAELGGTPVASEQVRLETPDIAENGAVVPVEIHSSLPNTSKIYVLVEKNPNPMAAAYQIMEGTDASIATRVKVAQTCLIYGVVEADGKLYMASKETKVTLGGCGG